MRFHIGCSFRLKNILKFIVPVIIGLCAYFGFNVLNVFALYDDSKIINLTFPINLIDLETPVPNLNKNIGEVVEELSSLATENNKNIVFTLGFSDSGYYGLTVYVNSQNYFNNEREVTALQIGTTGTVSNQLLSNGTNYFRFYYRTLTFNNSSSNSSYYNFLKDYLSSGSTSNLNNTYYLYPYQFGVLTDNNNMLDYTFSYSSSDVVLLYSNINFKLNTNDFSGATTRPLIINNEVISAEVYVPSYYDLMTTSNPSFNVLQEKLPNIYFEIDTNDLSNFVGKLEYYPFIDAQTYTDIVGGGNRYYYGRVNNNNHYYSYERLNCTISSTFDIGNDNKITHNYSNINCSNNLSNYDRIYYTETFDYYYDQQHEYNHAIIGAVLSSNSNHFISKDFKGHIYTKFNSNSGWKFLISSEIGEDIYIKNSDEFMLFSRVPKDGNPNYNFDVNGDPIGKAQYKFFFPDFMTFSFYHNNILIYDDYVTRGNTNSTIQEMIIYFPEYRIISIPYLDSNNNEVFDYIDNNHNISSSSFNYNYNVDSDNEGSFDFSLIFTRINNFFNDINTDLVNTHNLIQQFFDSTPSIFKIIIEIIFSLTLIYLIFKEVKR